MCNSHSVHEKLQRCSDTCLSACCQCLKISSCRAGWRGLDNTNLFLKTWQMCLMHLMRSVEKVLDLCCWWILQFVSICMLERSAPQRVVKTPSSCIAQQLFEVTICRVRKMSTWRGLHLTRSKVKLPCRLLLSTTCQPCLDLGRDESNECPMWNGDGSWH